MKFQFLYDWIGLAAFNQNFHSNQFNLLALNDVIVIYAEKVHFNFWMWESILLYEFWTSSVWVSSWVCSMSTMQHIAMSYTHCKFYSFVSCLFLCLNSFKSEILLRNAINWIRSRRLRAMEFTQKVFTFYLASSCFCLLFTELQRRYGNGQIPHNIKKCLIIKKKVSISTSLN